MKGFEIRRENEKVVFLFNKYDVVDAMAHAIYYSVNPESEMSIPNCVYLCAEKEFNDWFNDKRESSSRHDELRNELNNKISMALKDPVLQQYFEIMCKENAEFRRNKKNNMIN